MVSKIPYEERNMSNEWSHNVVIVKTGQYDLNNELDKRTQECNSSKSMYEEENRAFGPFYEVT